MTAPNIEEDLPAPEPKDDYRDPRESLSDLRRQLETGEKPPPEALKEEDIPATARGSLGNINNLLNGYRSASAAPL